MATCYNLKRLATFLHRRVDAFYISHPRRYYWYFPLGVIADLHARRDQRLVANPDIVANHGIAFVG